MIKAIITDMDGSLLDSEDQLQEATRCKLIELQQKGILLVLASGRSYMRLLPYAKQLNMKQYGGWLCEVNGMAVQNLKRGTRKIFAQLQREDVNQLFAVLKNYECEIHGNFDDGLFYRIPESMIAVKQQERELRKLPKDYPWTGGAWTWNQDLTKGYPRQFRVNSCDEMAMPLNKLSVLNSKGKNEWLYQVLMEQFQNQYEIVRTCPRIIEISPKGITKGNAIAQIMKECGLSKEEVLVFGDGENDVTMFDEVTHSVAMGNAEDYVKEKASAVTLSNDEQGILHYLIHHADL